MLLALVVSMSSAAALIGTWLHDTVVQPDGWNDAIGDLLEDDEVAAEVATIITDRLVASAIDELVDVPLLPGGIEARAEEAIRDRIAPVVERVMRSEGAESAWRTAVDRSHPSVVALVRDDDTGLVGDRRVRIDLAPLADRIVDTVGGALSDALSIGGLDIDLRPDLDVDLSITLLDLRDAETALDAADIAERHRVGWIVVAAASACGIVAIGPHRRWWLAVAGLSVAGAAIATAYVLRAVEPDGLPNTWAHITETADPYVGAVTATGIALLLGSVAAHLVRRSHI